MLRRVHALSFALFLAACSSSSPKRETLGAVAQAESDTFGLGTGRDGTLTLLGPTVVNRYAAITAAAAAGARTLTVDTTVGFATGGLVLVWQTTGLAPADAPSGTQTTIDLTGKPAGRYELGRIESVTATTITLTNPILGAYSAAGAQVVRVPEYTTLTISSAGSVVAQAWNGSKGGIAAVFVSGTLQNDGAIDASGAGFRAGPLQNATGQFGCTANDGWSDAGGGAHKGEGLVPAAFTASTAVTTPATAFGRGNVSVGGGGGDCHNSGGGGGGHGGKGGTGGNTWQGDPGAPSAGRAVGGLGGAALVYDFADHLAMGGGGGAGDENNDVGTGGAPGGGVVLVRANSITGTGFYTANGSDVPTTSDNDAAGGGGAGGAVVVRARTSAACSTISAKGGTGGSTTVTDHGTGGGGAGGRVLLDAPTGTCPISAPAGAHGTVSGGASWNATDGAAGTTSKSAGTVGPACSAADIAANKCGGCITNLDCTLAGLRTCFLGTHTCVACTVDADCSGATFCDTAAHACTPKLDNGLPIPTIAGHTPALTGNCSPGIGPVVCKSAVCDASDDDCGYADGHTCVASSECRSALCSTVSKVCVPAGGCAIDADCGAGKFCDTGAKTCKDKLANGSPIPTITGHTPTVAGDCNGAVGPIVCISNVCDMSDDRCGYLNGDGPCTVATGGVVCRSGVCDTDLKCGLADGDGPCTTGVVCRSGTCSTVSKTCGPPGGCAVDGDCDTTTQFCNTASKTCTARLSNGTAMPTIAGHSPTLDGTCTGAASSAVCVSKVCDTADAKCGFTNGHTCAAGGECRSTACGASSKVCIPLGGCATDPDCGGGAVCTGGTCGAPDAGADTGSDVGSDTGDSGTDASDATSDGAIDAASDGAIDAELDTAVDASPDSGSDSGSDASEDSGEPTDTGAESDGSVVTDGGDDTGAVAPDEGTLEGGGFSCSTGTPASRTSSGLLSLSFAAAALAFTRRRRA